MLMKELVQHFTNEKKYQPSHVNELLDYVQKCYIFGELSIVEYKNLFCELHKQNAEKPGEFIIKTNPTNVEFELPS